MRLPLLIVKAGSAPAEVVGTDGDYDAFFVRAFEDGSSRCTVLRAYEGAALPEPSAFGGVVITGSPASVRDELPWMERLGRWAVAAADAGVPVLGVCFGHQLLGEALGGRVEKNPGGPERGTIQVELTTDGRADPLFAGLPEAPTFLATHQDVILRPPSRGTRRLAGNASTEWQALAYGPRLRGVQFHPELTAPIAGRLFAARGIVAGRVEECAAGPLLLGAWDRHFVDRGGR